MREVAGRLQVPTDADRTASAVARRRMAQERAADLMPVIEEIRKTGITSAGGIARELTGRDIPTPRGSSTWTAVQVQRLLRAGQPVEGHISAGKKRTTVLDLQ